VRHGGANAKISSTKFNSSVFPTFTFSLSSTLYTLPDFTSGPLSSSVYQCISASVASSSAQCRLHPSESTNTEGLPCSCAAPTMTPICPTTFALARRSCTASMFPCSKDLLPVMRPIIDRGYSGCESV